MDLLGEASPKRKAFGAHENPAMKNDEWLTPPEILKALGAFDLDPCAPVTRPWEMAARHLTINDNGLMKEWSGRIWLNPPYSAQEVPRWLKRLADHGQGTALVFARTETGWFIESVWERATAVLFLYGRLCFHYVDGRKAKANAGAPSCLVAYGEKDATKLETSELNGRYIRLSD